MTARRRRRIRAEPDDAIPEAVAAWFAGDGSIPWEALLTPDCERVPEWWATWRQAYPDARPPADALPGQFPGT